MQTLQALRASLDPRVSLIPSHYYPVLLLTSAVLRKDCSKFWPKRYAHFQAAIPKTL
jgi:hypothetical protein